jgi:hypothetical protein
LRRRRGCIRKSRYSRAVRMKKNRSDAAARRSVTGPGNAGSDQAKSLRHPRDG